MSEWGLTTAVVKALGNKGFCSKAALPGLAEEDIRSFELNNCNNRLFMAPHLLRALGAYKGQYRRAFITFTDTDTRAHLVIARTHTYPPLSP